MKETGASDELPDSATTALRVLQPASECALVTARRNALPDSDLRHEFDEFRDHVYRSRFCPLLRQVALGEDIEEDLRKGEFQKDTALDPFIVAAHEACKTRIDYSLIQFAALYAKAMHGSVCLRAPVHFHQQVPDLSHAVVL